MDCKADADIVTSLMVRSIAWLTWTNACRSSAARRVHVWPCLLTSGAAAPLSAELVPDGCRWVASRRRSVRESPRGTGQVELEALGDFGQFASW